MIFVFCLLFFSPLFSFLSSLSKPSPQDDEIMMYPTSTAYAQHQTRKIEGERGERREEIDRERGVKEGKEKQLFLSHILIIDSSWFCRETNWASSNFS